MITSGKDDTLKSMLEKIQTPDDLKGKLGVYMMFRMTHPNSLKHLNFYIQLKDPKIWREIEKLFYPTFFDKVKKALGMK